MDINWGQLINTALQTAGAFGSNAATQQGLQLSQANLDKALAEQQAGSAGAYNQAIPYEQWLLDTGLSGQTEAFNQANAVKTQGMNASIGTKKNALASSLSALKQGYQGAVSQLQPYSEAGKNALARLTTHTLGGGGMSTINPTYNAAYKGDLYNPPNYNLPTSNLTSGPTQFNFDTDLTRGVTMPTAPAGTSPGIKPPNAMEAAAVVGTGGAGAAGLNAELASIKNMPESPLKQQLLSLAGAGAATGILLAVGASLTGPLAPLVIAAGVLLGPLISRLTRKGHEKEDASTGANDLGSYIENDLVTPMKAGTLTGDQVGTAVKAGWDVYCNWLRKTLKDTDVQAKSMASQAKFINARMQQLGIPITVNSPEGDQWVAGNNPY
jgi:hypothetical protein